MCSLARLPVELGCRPQWAQVQIDGAAREGRTADSVAISVSPRNVKNLPLSPGRAVVQPPPPPALSTTYRSTPLKPSSEAAPEASAHGATVSGPTDGPTTETTCLPPESGRPPLHVSAEGGGTRGFPSLPTTAASLPSVPTGASVPTERGERRSRKSPRGNSPRARRPSASPPPSSRVGGGTSRAAVGSCSQSDGYERSFRSSSSSYTRSATTERSTSERRAQAPPAVPAPAPGVAPASKRSEPSSMPQRPGGRLAATK